MKTIILFATKNGATHEIARRIADRIGGAQVHDLKQRNIPDLNQFDCVIVGSAVYAGMIRKEAKAFLTENAELLRGKRLGLFLSGMDATNEKTYFDNNFSPDILRMSTANSFLGGIFDPQKAGVMGRLVMKAVAKQSGFMDSILNDRIEKFAEAMAI